MEDIGLLTRIETAQAHRQQARTAEQRRRMRIITMMGDVEALACICEAREVRDGNRVRRAVHSGGRQQESTKLSQDTNVVWVCAARQEERERGVK